MTNRSRLLADVAELSNVLRAMDAWEATGSDLNRAQDRQCFVDSLDDDAAYELAGLALTNLVRRVFDEKAAAGETCGFGDDTSTAAPDLGCWTRHGYSQVAA